MSDTTIDAVLAFWLEEIGPDRWFADDPAIDAACVTRFGTAAEQAAEGRLQSWACSDAGMLALLILLDQIRRNIHRDRAAAYVADHRALALAKAAIDRGLDLGLPVPRRKLVYLPLMHSERLADQARCVRLAQLRIPGDDGTLSSAIKHREVIRRFGRFPSRNTPLGRRYSPAEAAYRDAGGYMG